LGETALVEKEVHLLGVTALASALFYSCIKEIGRTIALPFLKFRKTIYDLCGFFYGLYHDTLVSFSSPINLRHGRIYPTPYFVL